MEKKFGIQGCGGGCSMGGPGYDTFGSVMQNRMNQRAKMGIGSVGVGETREDYAWLCAADYENQIIAAGGDPFDDATWNSYMDLCRGEYDAGVRHNVPTGGAGDDIPQGYDPTKKCNSPEVIYYVQMMTGNPNPDKSWGPESQKYLDASGKTFMEIANEAGGCVGPAPVYVEPGNGDGGKTDVVIDVTTGEKQGNGLPWWAWALIGVGVFGLGVGGVYLATRDKEEEEGMEPALAGAEPKPRFVKKIERKYRGKKIASHMKRDSKGRFVAKKMSYKRR